MKKRQEAFLARQRRTKERQRLLDRFNPDPRLTEVPALDEEGNRTCWWRLPDGRCADTVPEANALLRGEEWQEDDD